MPTTSFPGIIAAKVTKVEKHPNADRLRVVELSVGHDQTVFPVVCGAFNFGVGDMVVLALPGAHIPHNIHSEQHEPFTLEKATIRGIESQGMICAGFELGLQAEPGDKPEILLLKPEVVPGQEFTPDMIQPEQKKTMQTIIIDTAEEQQLKQKLAQRTDTEAQRMRRYLSTAGFVANPRQPDCRNSQKNFSQSLFCRSGRHSNSGNRSGQRQF